jgi:hypothetical protein
VDEVVIEFVERKAMRRSTAKAQRQANSSGCNGDSAASFISNMSSDEEDDADEELVVSLLRMWQTVSFCMSMWSYSSRVSAISKAAKKTRVPREVSLLLFSSLRMMTAHI